MAMTENNSELENWCAMAIVALVTVTFILFSMWMSSERKKTKMSNDATNKQLTTKSADPAEIPDEILFKQPESSHRGDCPICFLPLPLAANKSTVYACCFKRVCNGCARQQQLGAEEIKEKFTTVCPFCRHPQPRSLEEATKKLIESAKENNPVAMVNMASYHFHVGDFVTAVRYYTMAAELGDVDAHYNLGLMLKDGQGVEKDERKSISHLKTAAIGGHPFARYNLGCYCYNEGLYARYDRAVKHFLIGARLGDDNAIQQLKTCYMDGHVSKEDFATALRAYQAAVDEMRSPQRDAVEGDFAIEYAMQRTLYKCIQHE